MGVVLRTIRSERACRILAMGSEEACPLFDFLRQLRQDNNNAFARLLALLDRTAKHGTVRNEQKFRYFKQEKIFEFKTRDGVRVMAFWDEKQLIVCSHGFLKKKQKTPATEIERAVESRNRYFEAKESGLLTEAQ